MKILSIGNSFSEDAQAYLHDIARADKYDLYTNNLYIGGCPLAIHYKNMLSKEPAYLLQVNGHNTYIKISLEEALCKNQWDVITVQQASHYSPYYDTYQPYLDGLLEKASASKEDLENIGIGMAGSCDKGVCLFMPNTEWRNIHLAKCLQKIYKVNVTVVNDLKGATLGELNFGIGKKCKDFVFVGLGTGLNIGVVKNGQYIIDGVEYGHITVDRQGPDCGCGKKGCLESIVSTKALLSYAEKHCKKKPQNVKELFEMAKEDKAAQKAVYEYIEALNIGLMNICNSYRPEIIVLGGGIGEGLKDYIDYVNKKLADSKYGYPTAKKTNVVVSKVGNDCGVLGVSTLR